MSIICRQTRLRVKTALLPNAALRAGCQPEGGCPTTASCEWIFDKCDVVPSHWRQKCSRGARAADGLYLPLASCKTLAKSIKFCRRGVFMRYSKKEDTLTRCTRRRTGVACFWYKKTKEKIPRAGTGDRTRRRAARARRPLRRLHIGGLDTAGCVRDDNSKSAPGWDRATGHGVDSDLDVHPCFAAPVPASVVTEPTVPTAPPPTCPVRGAGSWKFWMGTRRPTVALLRSKPTRR
jgi:hypothetical protein